VSDTFQARNDWSIYASTLLEPFYTQRYIKTGWCPADIQKLFDIDRCCVTKDETIVRIEEKCVKARRDCIERILIEDKSCTLPGRETPGWIYKTKADILLWANCFVGEKRIIIFTFKLQEMKEWWIKYGQYNQNFGEHLETGANSSLSKKVRIGYLETKGFLLEGPILIETQDIIVGY
jgi:hypothetical protein